MSKGRPGAGDLLRDAFARLRRPIIPTLTAIVILFAGTLAVFATTGLALASQQRTLERINSAAGRLITITDPQGQAGLSAASVEVATALSGVDWVAGIGPATDVVNANLEGSASAPARAFFGALPPAIATGGARTIEIGEAIAGPGLADSLGMADGVGAISGGMLSADVVGGFTADEPLASLNGNILVRTPTAAATARLLTLWVSVRDISQLPAVAEAVRGSLVVSSPRALRIDTSDELTQLSVDVAAELASSARLTVTGLLLAVAVLVGAVQYGRVAGMARDIGRRRALGATRSGIVVQILLNALLCGLAGALLGTAAGLVVTTLVTGTVPPVGFTIGIGTLVVLAALLGSLLPAIRAARIDPVKILRVP